MTTARNRYRPMFSNRSALFGLPLVLVASCSGSSPEEAGATHQAYDSVPSGDAPPADTGKSGDSSNPADAKPKKGTAPKLSGVFVPTFGESLTTEATLKEILDTPSLRAAVDGFYIARPWSELEPDDGTFDFTQLDDDLETAQKNHVKVTVSVGAGSSMPSWLCGKAGAKCASFVQIPFARPGDCTSFAVPIPWDPVFQDRWSALIVELGKNLAKYGTLIAAVKMTGINADTDETQLPHDSGGSVACTSGSACSHGTCAVTDAPSEWTTLGYTTSRVVTAWDSIEGAFAKAFPSTVLDVQIVGGGFPDDPTKSITKSIVSSGLSTLSGRFAVQCNGLDATGGVQPDVLLAAGEGAIAGYQMLQKVSGDPSCVMAKGLPKGTPCNATVLADAIDVGLDNEASFLEIYSTDVPAFTSTVACAEAQLALLPSSKRTCK